MLRWKEACALNDLLMDLALRRKSSYFAKSFLNSILRRNTSVFYSQRALLNILLICADLEMKKFIFCKINPKSIFRSNVVLGSNPKFIVIKPAAAGKTTPPWMQKFQTNHYLQWFKLIFNEPKQIVWSIYCSQLCFHNLFYAEYWFPKYDIFFFNFAWCWFQISNVNYNWSNANSPQYLFNVEDWFPECHIFLHFVWCWFQISIANYNSSVCLPTYVCFW